jgi:integrase
MCRLRRSKVLGLTWDCVDLDHGEIVVQAGRVLLDGRPTDDPKSAASRRTVPVEEIQPGTVALLRSLRARQAADRLVLGGWVPGRPVCCSETRWGHLSGPRRVLGPLRGVVPYG